MRPNESVVIYERGMEDYRLEDAAFIEGLPGIGLVSKISIAYILGKVKPVKICRLYTPHFPSYGFISDGKLLPHFLDVYGVEEPSPTIIAYGTSQPSTSYGQHELCENLIDIAVRHGANRVFTLGGLGGKENVSQRRRIYCSSTDRAFLEKYVRIVDGEVYAGQIVGAAGIMMVVAGQRGLQNMGMLIEIGGSMPDYYAAQRGVEALSKLCYLNMNEVGLSELITISSRTIARLEA
ncbi:MAG: PAC2 family protein [Nitrososphaerota archaeon]|nr:PAC2 family protein [Candidatus Calditenuaceae archaeon]MDW8072798.1 PAC2 family protein [Nitrososphaerota archaeon]